MHKTTINNSTIANKNTIELSYGKYTAVLKFADETSPNILPDIQNHITLAYAERVQNALS